MNIFVYGTLLDAKVRRLVTGRSLAIEPALIRGFQLRRALGCRFPILVARPSGRVQGALLRAPSGPAFDRLIAFEAGYALRPVAANARGRIKAAHLFLPAGAYHKATRQGWRLDSWRRRDRAGFLFRIRRWRSSPRS